MPSKNALNVSLTEQLCDFVAHQVASGRYRTASEVVRAALRALEREVEAATMAAAVEEAKETARSSLPSRSQPPQNGGPASGRSL